MIILKILTLSLCWMCCLSKFECNSSDSCSCFLNKNNVQYLCPINYEEVGGIVIGITKDKEISLECYDRTSIDINKLPKFSMINVNLMYIKSCPIDEFTLQKILNRYSIQSVGLLEVEYSKFAAILNKNHFAGFSNLEHLKLSRNDLQELDTNVFDNTPKILSLDLQENSVNLDGFSFKNASLLSLDLSSNKLKKLPNGVVPRLKNLINLQLWDNELTQIGDDYIDSASLQVLDLSANQISNISKDAFRLLKRLSHINLASNELHFLHPHLFKHNTRIEVVKLAENKHLQLPDQLFANLTRLKDVDLSGCNILEIPENFFSDSCNLTSVYLQNNGLKHLPNYLFRDLINLEELYLNDNEIESLVDVFETLRSLKVLHLQNNRISTIEEFTFGDLSRLEELNLASNQIFQIHPRAFGHDKLRKINLSGNLYAGKHEDLFRDALGIEEINFSHNLVKHFADITDLTNKIYLKNLDLSYNRIDIVFVRDFQSVSDVNINLDDNIIATVVIEEIDIISGGGTSIISLDANPLSCDCRIYNFAKFLKNELNISSLQIKSDDLHCSSPNHLHNLTLSNVPLSALHCELKEYRCPEECVCSWRPFDSTHIINCTNKNLADVPFLRNDFAQIELRLERNNLGPIISFGSGVLNITRLYLSSNKLTYIFHLPESLQVLHLDDNQFHRLSPDLIDKLSHNRIVELTLHNNPWNCDCGAHELSTFLRQHIQKVNSSYIFCANSTRRISNLTKTDLCLDYTFYIVVSISILAVFVGISIAFYYHYQQEIRVWLFANKLCLCLISEDDLDEDKLYDAFISYSHKDEEFVVKNLVPTLENIGYKLCLHHRDWIPGEFISTQITKSVLESRRTVVVLSENFLESVWGKVEFRIAHAKAMSENRGRVIVIMYGHVNVDEVEDELKAYLKTNTYVKWGDAYFWDKLRYALPHSICKK